MTYVNNNTNFLKANLEKAVGVIREEILECRRQNSLLNTIISFKEYVEGTDEKTIKEIEEEFEYNKTASLSEVGKIQKFKNKINYLKIHPNLRIALAAGEIDIKANREKRREASTVFALNY